MPSEVIYYTVYKTTCLVNNKIYIGIHETADPNDRYLGSGSRLKKAIKKYGRSQFKKEILFLCNDAEEMISKEKELVDYDFISRPDTYNTALGGSNPSYHLWIKLSDEEKSAILSQRSERMMAYNQKTKNDRFGPKNHFFGKHHNEATRQKQSVLVSRTNQSMCWITNGTETFKIKKTDSIPAGFVRGRVMANQVFDNYSQAQKGRKWYNDGSKNYKVFPDDALPSWETGKLKASS